MQLKGLERVKKIYFIGIGGVSMSALAKFLSTCGYQVSGSDATRGEETENLAFYGVKVFIGAVCDREELSQSDLIVYTDAIPDTHSELVRARELEKLGKRVLARPQLLSLVCEGFEHSIAIAGSHGKTTCTSMCAHVLKKSDLNQ